ncbi:MAG: hypothetical protein IKX79_02400 [Desulfovibrionaceae bacterium]|nr:hypothetical protein [Desulfovibrionaceae bacterium]
MPFSASLFQHAGLTACLILAALLFPFESQAKTPETLRWFQYHSSCGDKAPASGQYRNMSFSLYSHRVNISLYGNGNPEQFSGPASEALNRELSSLAAGLDLAQWKTPLSEAQCEKLSSTEKESLCRWSLTMLFEPAQSGQKGREVRLSGCDDGQNPGRLAAERAFTSFFTSKLAALQESTPKRIENVSWLMPVNGERASYLVSRNDDGKVSVRRRVGKAKAEGFADPSLLETLQKEVRTASADNWKGFAAEGLTWKDPALTEFSLTYDTRQSVNVRGSAADSGRLPKGYEKLLARLSAACDALLDAGGGPAPARPDALKRFSFSSAGSMMGKWPGYELYQRMEAGGPVMVLEHEQGQNKTECRISGEELQSFEALLKTLGIAQWDGFKGSDPRVLDGRSFSLDVRYWDGRGIHASGYMRWPKGYQEKISRIEGFLDDILAKHGASLPKR